MAEDLGSGDPDYGGLISDGSELLEEPYANTGPSKSLRCNVQAKRVLSSSRPSLVGEEVVDDQAVARGSAFCSPVDDHGPSSPLSLLVFSLLSCRR